MVVRPLLLGNSWNLENQVSKAKMEPCGHAVESILATNRPSGAQSPELDSSKLTWAIWRQIHLLIFVNILTLKWNIIKRIKISFFLSLCSPNSPRCKVPGGSNASQVVVICLCSFCSLLLQASYLIIFLPLCHCSYCLLF